MPIIAINSPLPVCVPTKLALPRKLYNCRAREIFLSIQRLLIALFFLLPISMSFGQSDLVTDIGAAPDSTYKLIVDVLADDFVPPSIGYRFSDQEEAITLLSDKDLKSESTEVGDSDVEKRTTSESELVASKLTPNDLHRKNQIARCLSIFYRMPVNTEDWRPWTIMHGLLPYGQQSKVLYKKKHYSAVDYLCNNAIGNDTYMLYAIGESIGVQVGPGVQGHEGQFLAMLAQANVPRDQPIQIQGKRFTVDDLIKYEQLGCRQNTELTFKLIGLSHYLDSDEVWQTSIGQSWNIERLLFEELKQPINGAACGGTHRLMGLSYAVNKRIELQKPADGQWARARNFVKQFQEFAMRYQNPDGSFSTNWFVTQEADNDIKKRLYTTGHIVEWLAVSLSQEKLADPRFEKSIDYLTRLMVNSPALDLEIGPKGHAIHALRIYESRVYGTNSNLDQISPSDMAFVRKSLHQQKQMKPEFDSISTGTPAQSISYPGQGFSNGGRRMFRRR